MSRLVEKIARGTHVLTTGANLPTDGSVTVSLSPAGQMSVREVRINARGEIEIVSAPGLKVTIR